MKDMKILHSMVYWYFWYSALYFIKNNFVYQCSKYRHAISRIFFCKMAVQNCLFIKYKDEYQKFKWTIECRIFISFIWSRSEPENPIMTTFSRKNWILLHKLACLDFLNRTPKCINFKSAASNQDCAPSVNSYQIKQNQYKFFMNSFRLMKNWRFDNIFKNIWCKLSTWHNLGYLQLRQNFFINCLLA